VGEAILVANLKDILLVEDVVEAVLVGDLVAEVPLRGHATLTNRSNQEQLLKLHGKLARAANLATIQELRDCKSIHASNFSNSKCFKNFKLPRCHLLPPQLLYPDRVPYIIFSSYVGCKFLLTRGL